MEGAIFAICETFFARSTPPNVINAPLLLQSLTYVKRYWNFHPLPYLQQRHYCNAGSFVNPEHRISADAKKLTGITDDMVKDLHLGRRLGRSLVADCQRASGHWLQQWPSMLPPSSVTQRYGLPGLVVADHIDAFKMHKRAHNTKSGKLETAAAWLSIDTKNFEGHRATNDAIMVPLPVIRLCGSVSPTFRHTGIVEPDGTSATGQAPARTRQSRRCQSRGLLPTRCRSRHSRARYCKPSTPRPLLPARHRQNPPLHRVPFKHR